MKKFSRLTALLLALTMLVTSMPLMALANSITVDIDTWNSWVEDAQNAATDESANATETVTTTVPVTGETSVVDRPVVEAALTAHEGVQTSATQAVTLPIAGKLVLKAFDGASSYQWQVKAGSQWANIVGDTSASTTLTYAKIQNAISGGTAQVRCVMVVDGQDYVSATALVTVDETVTYTTVETESTLTVTAEVPVQSNYVLRNSSVSTYADTPSTYNIVINYVFENNEIAADPYTANLAAGSSFSTTVTFPTVQGYLPYLNEVQQDNLELSFTAIDQDYTYNVVYKPTNVDYTVIHYQQNLNDDKYTEAERETKQGLTGSTVPEVAKTYEGFYALLYERPTIAADGSTVVEVYYDRYYYLMNFDLDGGYGVEPIYARYGAPIDDVGTPTKAGYSFQGWSLDGTTIVELPENMPAANLTYKAVWGDAQVVDYTVVYWRENANDSNYSFWGQVTKQALVGTLVSGADDVPTSITTATVDGEQVDERVYFTYNSAKTNKDVEVKGDGTTIVNVYYYRNTYHLYFYGISGQCAIEEHTHGDGNCNSYLDCLQEEHTHDENCERILVCTLAEHEHTQECYTLTCGQEEHTEHTEDCLECELEEHDHATSGCSLICGQIENHVHDASCYPDTGAAFSWSGIEWYVQGTEENGAIGESYNIRSTGNKYLYYNGTWYKYTGSAAVGSTVSMSCTLEENHEHTDACYDCGLINHTHSDSCYNDTLHTHDLSCYAITCGQTAHTHTDSCYAYTCGAEDHVHDSSCYRPCTKLEHTHSTQCTSNSANNVIWVISAKYEQNIADVWPTADKFTDYKLHGWTVDGITNSTLVSKRVSMTADLCDTTDNLKYAKANSGGSETILYYMFESFDQTSSANGETRILRNDVYYDSDSRYYQVVNSSGNWNQKPIEGMSPVSNGVVTSGNKVYLYYTRNRSNLMFNNSSDGIVKTVSSIMYEQPLANYKDSDGNLISAFVPSYPSKLEPNAYEFQGWYLSPECYEGTEFDFSTATMPNGDLTLYAYWKPITHTVSFYLDADALEAGTKLSTHPDITVPHGSKVDPVPEDPENGSYTFVGWFYMDGSVEKAFDFANMPVNKDLQVYGKWSSNVLKQYTILYKIQDTDTEIADPTTGSGLAGVTKTFEAKGGTELYADYQEGYFPVAKSHSMTIDINATEENDTNVYTFWYVQKDAVPYTVKYLNKETGEPVATEKTVSDNRKAVVTETFVPVSGMMPDAYQKRLVVSAEEGAVNEIIFYYTEDTTHAYYKITHYTENLGTDAQGNPTWTEYASSQAVGDIGTTYTADPMTITGFTYDSTVTGTVVSGELTANGLELKLYYTRNSYPYQVRYLEQGTNKQLAEPKVGTGKYGEIISESAIDIANYTAVAPTSQTLNIRIEEGTEVQLNIITFYYTEKEATINYVVVGPDGCGTVSPTSETLKVLTGTAQGSTPTANENFKFVGWYTDAACETLVDSTWVDANNKITPVKADNTAWVNGTTYYAKFVVDKATLTISKTGMDSGESAIFNVAGPGYTGQVVVPTGGSVTLFVTCGEYTITEVGGWTNRYSTSSSGLTNGKVTLTASGATVAFTNTKKNDKWLHDESAVENFTKSSN
ncbi:MAG: InlB B-repeat-containing protein [Aristaeellaceae bacterium]